jgi:two-component sensor histidine kinase
MAALENLQDNIAPVRRDLLAESNHRIANHLTLLVGMVQMQDSKVARGPEMLPRADVRALLRETTGKIVGVGNLHRRLSRSAEADHIDLGSYLIEYAKELMEALALTHAASVVERLESGCRVTPDQAQTITLILGEIVMNAVKHAHPAGLPLCINLACGRNEDGGVSLEICDDGVGFPENFDHEKSAGIGLKLIRTLAKKIDAALEIESDSLGLTFRLRVPRI